MAKSKRIRDLNANMKARYRLDRQGKEYISRHELGYSLVGCTFPTKHPKSQIKPSVVTITDLYYCNKNGEILYYDDSFHNFDLLGFIAGKDDKLKEGNFPKPRYFYISRAEDNIVKTFNDFQDFKTYITPEILNLERKAEPYFRNETLTP